MVLLIKYYENMIKRYSYLAEMHRSNGFFVLEQLLRDQINSMELKLLELKGK